MNGPRRRLATGLSQAAAVLLVVGWALLLRPAWLGGPVEYVIVRGDSMLPTLSGGDLVIVRHEDHYQAGDVVAYHVPRGELGEGRLVIHRLIAGDSTDGFVVLGDNNPAPDPWLPRGDDIAGRAWLVIPSVGMLPLWLHSPAVAASLALAILAAGAVLRWRPVPAPRTPAPPPRAATRSA